MAPNISAILDRRPSEIEKPKPIPQGTYYTVIVGMPRYDKSSKKQTDFVEFQHKIVQAGDDVDQDALAEALTNAASGETRSLQDIVMKNTYYLTDSAAWRVKDFLHDCGFDIDDDSLSLREMVEQTAGRQVGVFVKHRPSQDGQSVFAEIDHTIAME